MKMMRGSGNGVTVLESCREAGDGSFVMACHLWSRRRTRSIRSFDLPAADQNRCISSNTPLMRCSQTIEGMLMKTQSWMEGLGAVIHGGKYSLPGKYGQVSLTT